MSFQYVMSQIGIALSLLAVVGVFGWIVYLQSERNSMRVQLDYLTKELNSLRDKQWAIERKVNV